MQFWVGLLGSPFFILTFANSQCFVACHSWATLALRGEREKNKRQTKWDMWPQSATVKGCPPAAWECRSQFSLPLFSGGLFSNDSMHEAKDTRSSRLSDRYPAGLCNTRGQSVERLIGGKPKITCSLSRHLVTPSLTRLLTRLGQTHTAEWIWNGFLLLSLLSCIFPFPF